MAGSLRKQCSTRWCHLSDKIYGEGGETTNKTIRDYLKENGAYLKDGKLYDPGGRELYFLRMWDRSYGPGGQRELGDPWRARLKQLKQTYRVVVIESGSAD